MKTKPTPAPCPVCGQLPLIGPIRRGYDGRILYWTVQCFYGCRHNVRVEGKTQQRAVDVWNSCFPQFVSKPTVRVKAQAKLIPEAGK